MKMRHKMLGAISFLGLMATVLTAQAQGVIKIGEINSYKAQPAFLEPHAAAWP